MERKDVNKKMKQLANAGLLDNFSRRQKKCLRDLLKNELDFVIIGKEGKVVEECLFEAKNTPL